ncbi:polysaccharide pyruvyl transferase family protein [Streptomyces phyllanthi]|uniref:Polysaccharide pyruvyl transferase family protein n=1 Tax=Streptomyces phyllanthi TaxID=1803180 RepID=A0A5N8WDM4_9ACTN|nr:polysaccharide pyruvyl transferase family protein [Streptomyces phyllanthi]MPY44538.1 polysaccharide pyruvyl transferase family protein [Streptomyces phyllanthi]
MNTNPTGKRRIAFACHVDEGRLPGLLALLRSLALSNPGVCEDFVVLHPGLSEDALAPAHRLHPRVVARRADRRLDIFRIDDYDTVIALDPGMIVRGDITELMRMRYGIGAVLEERDDGKQVVRSGGPLVIQREWLSRATAPESLEQIPDSVFVRLGTRYDFPVSRLRDDVPVPEHAAIVRFAADHRPWQEERDGYRPAEQAWRRFDLDDEAFWAEYCALPTGSQHPELLTHCVTPLLERRPTVDLARTAALAHRAQGRYEAAVEALTGVTAQANQPRFHETLGAALMAVSRYDEAETHLLLATASPEVAPKAFAQLARLAWLRGADDQARAYARQGLDAEPLHRGCHALYTREPYQLESAAPDGESHAADPAEQLAHVAMYSTGQENAGDKVLPEAVRLCLDTDTGPRRWHSVHVHRLFDEAAVADVNARRGLIVGGGGLFLPDTWPNGNSAWQWNVPDAMLARITVPLAVFAVGYNVFDGQADQRSRFTESLRTLVERSAFFGLRNRGSVERVREMLPAELRDRVRYQPCPTTVTRQLTPGWTDAEQREDTVLINCAYDRAGLRFGHDYGHFLDQMATAVRTLRRHTDVRYAPHTLEDERFVHDLRREHGLTLPVEPLYDASNSEVRDVFRRAKLVIGMRGHAGMIPFGCGTPVISLISHPKMAYFLSDIGRPEWGISVHDRDLGPVLTERVLAILKDHQSVVSDVLRLQQQLWAVTRANVAELKSLFGTG